MVLIAAASWTEQRASAHYRRRWDSEYLVNLAITKGSFIGEYRVDPGGFDVLIDLLSSRIGKDPIKSAAGIMLLMNYCMTRTHIPT